MSKIVLCAALLAASWTPLSGQQPTRKQPTQAQPALKANQESANAQPAAADFLDELFTEYDSELMPGMSVAVVHRGRVVYAKGFGMANLEQGVRNSPETIFRIGSTSKQFTAMCIAMLHLRGELDLDADIRTYLPEMPEFETPVTVRQLVHHLSGIPDYPTLHENEGISLKAHVTAEMTYKRLTELTELEFAPGTEHAYSNSNYFLMGEIVRRVSGKTLREFAHANIFEPLGMSKTHYHDRHDELVPGRADGYSPDSEKAWVWRKDNTQWDHVGDGGVFTTVLDMAKWDANFQDNKLEGGQELMDLMHSVGVLADGTETTYAFGLNCVQFMGQPVVGHGGGWVGFRAEFMRFPEQQLSIVILSNCARANPSELAQRAVRLLL